MSSHNTETFSQKQAYLKILKEIQSKRLYDTFFS